MGDRKSAVDFYNAGVTAINDKSQPTNIPHAYQCFVASCYADPTYGEAFYQAGNNNSDLQLLAAAIACFRRALECENDNLKRAKILTNLGWRLHCLGQTDEAHNCSAKATELDPTLAYAWLNLSLIYTSMNQHVTALSCAHKAFALSPTDSIVEMALAFCLLFAQHFTEGLKHFEARFAYKFHKFLHYPYPKWDGTPGKTVLIEADQGLGDTLSFARFIEAASERASFLHLAVQPGLMRAFSYAFVHLKNVNLIPTPFNFPIADYWSTFVSLPAHLGLSESEFLDAPGISLPYFQLPKSWKVSGRKFHIGIAYCGSPLNDNDKYRNVPVTQFLDLYKIPGVQLYSFQVGDRVKDLHESGSHAVIKDLSPYITDVTDTASLLHEMDLVISIESALHHISGAIGKETWVPYAYQARDYRMSQSGKTPIWYKNHRLFSQGRDLRWQPVFDDIVKALQDKLS